MKETTEPVLSNAEGVTEKKYLCVLGKHKEQMKPQDYTRNVIASETKQSHFL